MYVEVVVDRPIIKIKDIDPPSGLKTQSDEERLALTFHYHLPPDLADQIQVGQLVAVPFRTEQLQAIVVGLSDSSPIEQTRPIAAILDATPVVMPAQIALARWLSHEYLTSLSTCLRYFLPPGSSYKSEFVLKPTGHQAIEIPLNAPEQILLTFLQQKGVARLAEVNLGAANALLKKGLARKESVLAAPQVGPKVDRTVELLISPTEIEAVLTTLGHSSKAADLLLYLADSDDSLPDLTETLTKIGCTEAVAKSLAEKGWLEIFPKESRLDLSPTVRQTLKKTTAPGNDSSQQIESTLNPLTTSAEELKVLTCLAMQSPPILLETILETTAVKRTVLNTLVKKKLLARFDEPAHLALKLSPAELIETVVELRGAQKHAAILRLLKEEEGALWIGWVYAQTEANIATLRDLAQANLITIGEVRRWRDPLTDKVFALDTPPELTTEQQAVWQKILAQLPIGVGKKRTSPRLPILLHGVTGSGKTEIYLRTIAAVLEAGQQAIMLVPEITLATQAIVRLSARFPDKVAIWHSALSPGERYDNWDRVRHGELPIVVGPRSALFAPLQNLGVIVVDEEHEPAYKQSDRAPLYHARDAAVELGRWSGALVILGSASPDVVTYRKAERGEYQLFALPNRPVAHQAYINNFRLENKNNQPHANSELKSTQNLPLPKVEVVDLRAELKAGNRTIFSRALQTAMRETFQRGEQLILFLNRRGTATFVNCRDCGYVQRCPHCDTTLTYHAHGEKLICHYCGHRQEPLTICPQCQGFRIRYFGLGTQRVEEMVKEMFSQATTIRWDQDTSRKSGSHEAFLQYFMNGQANVMIGTQMVAKGLDFPLVTLVGVISADSSLYLPDFRAGERTFQLLMQVAGRAGRSSLGGRVIIQTYNPDLTVIKAAIQHDYQSFYKTELAFRQEQRYPPFKRLAILLYSGSGEERSAAESQKMVERLRLHVERQGLAAVEIIGPTPHYVPRIRSQYRWYILLRASQPADVLRPLIPLPLGWQIDIDPVSML